MLELNLIHTVAFSGVVLFLGYAIRRLIPPLSKYNIPAPVIGGLLVAVIILIARRYGVTLFQFDTTLQNPLMIAFFTTIGFGASFSLLKAGGPQVITFLIIATILAVVQNIVGIALAFALGVHPLFGVLSGSVTLTGGPATGLAFAPLFEQAGVTGAATIAVSAAVIGILTGGLFGGPIGTQLIEHHGLKQGQTQAIVVSRETEVPDQHVTKQLSEVPPDKDAGPFALMKSVVIILLAMWMGSWLSQWVAAMGITLPAYIGAMIIAAILRNLDDATNLLRLSQRITGDLGSVALSLFIVMALMALKLWELAGLALPLLVILMVQVVVIVAVCFWPIFQIMGRDYDSAVMSSGFCGFMLGTTANAMANMESLVERYGPAPRAFLVVPIVGAFFIDFTNAMIITACLNIWK